MKYTLRHERLSGVLFVTILLLFLHGARAQTDCLEKGRQFFGGKNYKQAVMTLSKCENNPDAQRLLGLAYYELNYMSDAREYLDKAMKAFPEEIGLKEKHAMSFARNRQFRRAVEEFRRLAKTYPKNRDIKRGLALSLGWNRDYDEAIGVYNKILKKDPEDFESWIQVGVLTSWDKRFSEAAKIYKDIIAANPPREYELDARVHLGEVLSWMKKFDAAVAEYDKAIALDPKAVKAYLGKGRVLEWQGKYKGAIIVYERALQADSGNKDARARLQQLMWVR
ncbi:MAG: tetratricopeptide repeat protein [Chitinivibrionales bacterium]|nr:tetratricopeptide repeat protein [Chitinivibrionales bacterium]MBD3396819.1 tetratricopeptide repeat protein [Chitinivibrionales bacterium]